MIASKFDSSKNRKKKVGRPLTDSELEALILQINKRNPRWGYDRIADALGRWCISPNCVEEMECAE